MFGAPYIDAAALCTELGRLELPGVRWRPCAFQPAFQKHRGQLCAGAQLHVTDRQLFAPYCAGLAVLWVVRQLWPEQFAWRTDVYEFRSDVPAIDLLTGLPAVREAIDRGQPFADVVALACSGTETYDVARPAVLIY